MHSENQQTTPGRYTDSRILIGNWNEEKFTKKEKFRKFLLKRDRGSLISQQNAQIFANFLKEIQLEVPCDFIRFGAIVQLHAPNMPKINSMEGKPLVVSIAMNGITGNQRHVVNSDCILSLAPSHRPCVRNAFIITRLKVWGVHMKFREDANLNYLSNVGKGVGAF